MNFPFMCCNIPAAYISLSKYDFQEVVVHITISLIEESDTANKEATEPMVPREQVEVITSGRHHGLEPIN